MPVYRQSIDAVLQRLRDPQGTTHSRDLVLSMLNASARTVNAALAMVVETITLTTQPHRIFYSVTQDLPRCIKLIGVKEAGRSLDLLPWTDFWYTHAAWQREQAGRFRAYSMIGRDVLVIWPAKDRESSVDVTYSLLLPVPDTEGADTGVPDHALPAVEDLTELLLAVRGRDYPSIDPCMKAFSSRIKVLDE